MIVVLTAIVFFLIGWTCCIKLQKLILRKSITRLNAMEIMVVIYAKQIILNSFRKIKDDERSYITDKALEEIQSVLKGKK
ncbi:hypothetical protein LO80_03245 [Candidatus Francisella endociliophora]|uniref:Uncharacterized protein n=1 Tax=Candidatus Francisella endociliophora TaxID=653937 RepID=A0A097ENE2_9GAMM|nr:hypothetical protein [Francisella sp. FSC1006]AIT09083.1 hypothetical protein LO80_03245 [Francisella sp. FSC1006]